MQSVFAEFGAVKAVKIVTDNYTNRSRGFGFVEMLERTEGEKAIEKLNNTTLNMQFIVVSEARPKNSERSGGFPDKSFNKRY